MKKTLKIPIEQKEKFDDLRGTYQEAFRLAYAGYDYEDLRNEFPEFSSQVVSNAKYDAKKFTKQVLETRQYPKEKAGQNPLLRKQDIDIDLEEKRAEVIYKPYSRISFDIYPSRKQIEEAGREGVKIKGARLVKEDKFELHLTLEKEVKTTRWKDCKAFVGVDIGINYLAVCSVFDGEKFGNPKFFKGGGWKHRSRKEKNSNKSYKNWKENKLHKVSKGIVGYAKQFKKPVIVLERFNNFNQTNTKNEWNNYLLNTWARSKLQGFIEYKANWEGIPVFYVNPYNTSKICHYCGSKGQRDGIKFKCANCEREYNADSNAAMNIAKKALDSSPMSQKQ